MAEPKKRPRLSVTELTARVNAIQERWMAENCSEAALEAKASLLLEKAWVATLHKTMGVDPSYGTLRLSPSSEIGQLFTKAIKKFVSEQAVEIVSRIRPELSVELEASLRVDFQKAFDMELQREINDKAREEARAFATQLFQTPFSTISKLSEEAKKNG